jgi:gliding motility-associated lipoprotein GldH
MKNLPLFVLALLCASCGPDHLFEAKHEMPNAQWAYRDSLVFEFEVKDTSSRYDFFLNIDYQKDKYPFQNLYMRFNTVYPNGKSIKKQLSFDIFAPTGEPLDAGSRHIALQENAFFNQPGKHRIVMEQFTRRDSLPGIGAVGLEIVGSRGGKDKQ